MQNLIFTLISLFVFSSCATNFEIVQFERSQAKENNKIERVFDKNYEINVPKTVYVGEPIIKIKDYYTSTSSGKRLEIIQDSKYPSMIGTPYNICGETEDGLLVIQIATNPKNFACQVEPPKNMLVSGDLVDQSSMKAVQTWQRMQSHEFNEIRKNTGEISIYDWDRVYKKLEDTVIDTSKGYDNFEIIYSGIANQNTIRTLYREYSPSDLARSDFFQELTYPIDKKAIRFKDITIDLINAENDKVTFKVVNDNRN